VPSGIVAVQCLRCLRSTSITPSGQQSAWHTHSRPIHGRGMRGGCAAALGAGGAGGALPRWAALQRAVRGRQPPHALPRAGVGSHGMAWRCGTHLDARRVDEAADAATAAPDERAPAAKPRKDRAVHVSQRPQPATQGQARPGPQRTAIDGRPLRAGAREPCLSERLRWRRVAWTAAATRGSARTRVETHFLSPEGHTQLTRWAGRPRPRPWHRVTEWRARAEGRAHEANEAAGRGDARLQIVERARIVLGPQLQAERLDLHLLCSLPGRTCGETRTGTKLRHERLRANGEFAALTGAGRWWYGIDEGLAARGWGQQNYCGRCSGPQHKQSSDRQRLAWAVIGQRGGAHASTATRVERKTSCPPRSTRPKSTPRRATAGLAQQLRESSLAPCTENAF
jgi:hypothetical protein